MPETNADALKQELFANNIEKDLPAYDGPRSLFSKYLSTAKTILYRLKPYLHDELGKMPSFKYAKASFTKMPTMYQRLIEVSPSYIKVILRPVGRVFGSYDHTTDTILADPELASPGQFMQLYQHEMEIGPGYVRKRSRPAGKIRKPPLVRVLGEEIVHYAQSKIGAIDRYIGKYGHEARDYIEGAASVVSDYLFGSMNTYPREREKFSKLARRIGYRNALEGKALPAVA